MRLAKVLLAASVVTATAPLLAVGSGRSRDAEAGVQQCNTRCQTEQTDCILQCDGDRDCIEKCKAAAQECVKACSRDGGGRD